MVCIYVCIYINYIRKNTLYNYAHIIYTIYTIYRYIFLVLYCIYNYIESGHVLSGVVCSVIYKLHKQQYIVYEHTIYNSWVQYTQSSCS